MKKFVCLAVFFCFIQLAAKAQLAGTKWSGTMKIPQSGSETTSTNVEWDFSRDTCTVLVTGSSPEVFTYKDVKKVLTLSKVSGESPCPDGAKITMAYTIKKDELAFASKTTDCDYYNGVVSEAPLKKMK